LYKIWQQGEYQPYTTQELIDLIADLKPTIPPYCRVNRIIRDIPADYIVAGNRRSSLRQDILAEVARRGQACGCIRCHEVQGQTISLEKMHIEDYEYSPAISEEHFISYRTAEGHIAGYLRLSLPQPSEIGQQVIAAIPELRGAALIREVHVFGQALAVGEAKDGAAQHIGLGSHLIAYAEQIARQKGCRKIAVIAAVGTRQYYQARGFSTADLYMLKSL